MSVEPGPPPMPPMSEKQQRARRRDQQLGLGLIAVSFVVAMVLSWFASEAAQPETPEPPAPPTSEGLGGFPAAVDPIAALALARGLTPRKLLTGIVAEGVRSDGTVNVADGTGLVRYHFESRSGEGPQPERPRGTLPRGRYCGRQQVVINSRGIAALPDQTTNRCRGRAPEGLPVPRCDLQQVWAKALDKGWPSDKLAKVEFYRAKAGPAWRFMLIGTKKRFVLYGDCGKELVGKDATGSVL